MRNKFINGAKVCAHLKNLFTEGGADSVNNYADYINKQSQKKKLSLEFIQELNEISLTISWWKENVMKKLDRTSLQEKKHQQESKKEQRLISYFVNNIISGKWTLDDIKSEAYRELVKDYFEASPFGLPQNNQALVMADSVQDTVITVRPEEVINNREDTYNKFTSEYVDNLLIKYNASYKVGSNGNYNDSHGSNSNSELLRDGRKFKKYISDTIKAEIPGLKYSIACSFRGWYDKCTVTLKVNKADLFKSYAEVQKGKLWHNNFNAFEVMKRSLSNCYNHEWTSYNQELGQLIYEEYYQNVDDYADKYQQGTIKDNFAQVIRFITKLLQSFSYDCSDIQTDYFDSGLSYRVEIEILDKDIEQAQKFKEIFNSAKPNNEIDILKHYPDYEISQEVKDAIEEQRAFEKAELERMKQEEELRKLEEKKKEQNWFAGLVSKLGERSANFVKSFIGIFDNCLHFNIDLELNYSKPGDKNDEIAKAIADKVGGYNDWNPKKFRQVMDIMDKYSIANYGGDNPNNGNRDWTMKFGRESSIVTYIDATFQNEEVAQQCYKEIENTIHPDELSIEQEFDAYKGIYKVFRLWRD